MAVFRRVPRLWLWAALVLPLLLVLTLAAVLILSPTQRIRFLVPWLTRVQGQDRVPREGADLLQEWTRQTLQTEAGFAAAIAVMIGHADAQVRRMATRLAYDRILMPPPPALDEPHLALLRAAIDDPDPAIAGPGIRLLARLGDGTSLGAVLARLGNVRLPAVTSDILFYLGHLAPERLDSEAERLVRLPAPYQWGPALSALGRFPSTCGLGILVACYTSDDPQRSAAACAALALAARQLGGTAASPRVDRQAFLQLLRGVIADRGRDLVVRQHLLLWVVDQEAAYRLCQDLLRQTQDHRRTAELAIHALHSLERSWHPYLSFSYTIFAGILPDNIHWLEESWQAFSEPRADEPLPAHAEVLAAVRDAILASDRAAAGPAITQALTRQLGSLSGDARIYVLRIIEELATPDPSFDW